MRERGIRDTRLIERALREGWPVPEEYRKPVIDRQVKIAVDPASSPREATSAAKTLLMASRLNLDATALAAKLEEDPQQTQVNVQVNVGTGITQALHEPEYLDYLRERGEVPRGLTHDDDD